MALHHVYEEIRDDDRWDHLRGPGIVLVPGRGNEHDPVAMLVGEAPGATENTRRRVFCGPSGKVLERLMMLAGLRADDNSHIPDGTGDQFAANAFITNVVKYRPPGNRTPNDREIMFAAEALRREWVAVGRPRLLVAVGAVARKALCPVEAKIAPGNFITLPDGATTVWVQYHPAYGLRRPAARPEMEAHWEEMGQWIQENVRS